MIIEQEYQSLRNEMNESKRYVFERPLLTILALITIAQFINKHYLYFLPFTAILLFTYNLWFTINRLRSASRIAAYIQVVLESPIQNKWVGWETFLRFQRIWLKEIPVEERKEILRRKMSQEAIPDALFYYPAIFNFHITIVLLSMIISIISTLNALSAGNIIALIASSISSLYFLFYCWKVRPSTMKGLIEEYKAICEEVLSFMNSKTGANY